MLQDKICDLEITLTQTKLAVIWQKKKTGNGYMYEQSANLPSSTGPWLPYHLLYLGGIPTKLWYVVKEEKKATKLTGFTGFIYNVEINGKTLSLKRGTVYSKDGLINAFGASQAGKFFAP